MAENRFRPLAMDGVSGAGVGGANMRMNSVNRSVSLAVPVGETAVISDVFSGRGLKRHPGVSDRSWGKSSFVTPISTLYASPEKTRRDLFCAFQPKRVMVPSLPLRFSRPEIPRNCLALECSFLLA